MLQEAGLARWLLVTLGTSRGAGTLLEGSPLLLLLSRFRKHLHTSVLREESEYS